MKPKEILLLTLALTLPLAGAEAQQWTTNNLPSGLIAWWQAEGNAADATANHHDGTAFGGVSYGSGPFGSGIAFDGTNGVVEVPDSPAIRLTNALTIEFWAKRQRFGIDFVLEKGGDWNSAQSGEANYGVSFHSGKQSHALLHLPGWLAGHLGRDRFCLAPLRGGGHQRSGQSDFYIDGLARPVEFSEGAGAINLYPSSRPLHLGAQLSPDWNYFGNNMLDDVRLYNRALSASEIAWLAGQLHTVKLVPVQNAQIDSDAPDTLFDDWGVMDANKSRRILLQFDLSTIPTEASITSAKLGIVSRAPYNYAYSAVQEVWRVENDAWNQSTVTWSNFVSGNSNFLAVLGGGLGQHYCLWNLDLNAWNTAADLANDKFTVLVMRSLGAEYGDSGMTYYSRAVPNPNNGSGQPDADIVPYLEITYTGNPPVIPPPLIQVLAHTNNQLTLAWNTFPGWSYQLQANAVLGTTNWTAVTGANYAGELTMTNPVAAGTAGQNFFRVQQFSR